MNATLSQYRLIASAIFTASASTLVAIWVSSVYLIPVLVSIFLPAAATIVWFLCRRIDLIVYGVLLTRASVDPVLATFSGGVGSGPGAIFNLAILYAGTYAILTKQWRKQAAWFSLPWFIWLTTTAFSLQFSSDVFGAFRTWLGILSHFAMIYLGFVFSNTLPKIKKLTFILLAASLIPTVLGLANMFMGYDLPFGEDLSSVNEFDTNGPAESASRVRSTFPHPNIFAFFLLTTIALSIYAAHQALDYQKKRLFFGYGCIQLVLLVGTQTRSGWLAGAILLTIYAFAVKPKLLIVGAFSLLLLPLIPTISDRIFDVFGQGTLTGGDDGFRLNSFAWRKILWESSRSWIEARPWFGHGLDTFPESSLTFFPLEVAFGFSGFDAHNTFVQMAFEAGIISSLAFLFIYLAQIIYAFMGRQSRVESSLLAGLALGYLLGAMSDNMHRYLVANWYHAFLCGMLISSIALYKNQAKYQND